MVPLDGAGVLDDNVRVPSSLEQVRSAPNVDIDINLIDDEQEPLVAHYGEPTQILAGHDGPEVEMTRSEQDVTFPKDKILELIRERVGGEKADQADKELPEQVDPPSPPLSALLSARFVA